MQGDGIMELLNVSIKELIPNNFYLNEDKVESIRQIYNNNNEKVLPPIIVGIINGEYSLIDGHSRALVAFENGKKDILAEVYLFEEVDGPTKLYNYLHDKAKELNLTSIEKLQNRILDSENHKLLWIEYCQKVSKNIND